MNTPADGRLHGHRVLVTRPSERAAGLMERIAEAGGVPLAFPVIEIVPRPLPQPPVLSEFSAVLFVSPAAVAHGVPVLSLTPDRAPPIGAVGSATAAELEAAGLRVDIRPEGTQNSEGLLACDALQPERIAGRRVLIVRGEGGRERLADGLMERGASVEYAEVYRRARPARYDPGIVLNCDILTATSAECLENLLAMVPPSSHERVLETPLAVAAGRIAERAHRLGFRGPVTSAPQAGDDGMMAALLRCVEQMEPRS